MSQNLPRLAGLPYLILQALRTPPRPLSIFSCRFEDGNSADGDIHGFITSASTGVKLVGRATTFRIVFFLMTKSLEFLLVPFIKSPKLSMIWSYKDDFSVLTFLIQQFPLVYLFHLYYPWESTWHCLTSNDCNLCHSWLYLLWIVDLRKGFLWICMILLD